MDKKTFEKVCDTVEENIKNLAGKGLAIKPDELECLNKLVNINKNLACIKEMELYDEGYSESDGNSYRRGRSPITGRYVSRDAMPYHDAMSYGEFYGVGRLNPYHDSGNSADTYHNGNSSRSYGGGNFNRDYSGHSQKDMQIYHLEQMMNSATSDDKRQFLQNWLNQLRNS